MHMGSEENPAISIGKIRLRKIKNEQYPSETVLQRKGVKSQIYPKNGTTLEVVITFKKAKMANIENYKSEPVTFRSGYSTIGHLQTLRTLIERTTDYNVPIHLTIIDIHEVFDSTDSIQEVIESIKKEV